jgi:hypothetical protein
MSSGVASRTQLTPSSVIRPFTCLAALGGLEPANVNLNVPFEIAGEFSLDWGTFWDHKLFTVRAELSIMAHAGYPAAVLEMAEVQATARTLSLEVTTLEIRRAEDIAPAFEALKGRAGALYVCGDPLTTTNRVRINTLALAARLPMMYSILAAARADAADWYFVGTCRE